MKFEEKVKTAHEWELAYLFKTLLKSEDYEACGTIKKEIDIRIADGTINANLMQGFKKFDRHKQEFYGEPNVSDYNGLFDNYKF